MDLNVEYKLEIELKPVRRSQGKMYPWYITKLTKGHKVMCEIGYAKTPEEASQNGLKVYHQLVEEGIIKV